MCTRDGFSSEGFTTLQFLVALILLVVTIGLAAPTLGQFSAKNPLILTSNAIETGLNLARSTAINERDDISICPSHDGAECAEGSWDNGWIVFNDADGDGRAVAGEIIRVVTIENELSRSGFGENMVFQTDGSTNMDADAAITHCRDRGVTDGSCANVTVSQLGLNDPAKYQTNSDSTPPIEEPTS